MQQKPIVIGVIPARYESRRFHGKVIAPIMGFPMIYHVYQGVRQAKWIDQIVVATDHDKVMEVCHQFQIPCQRTQSNHICGTDRVHEIAEHTQGDIYINIQGDEPLIQGSVIDATIQPFLENPATQITTLKKRISNIEDLMNPNIVKVITNQKGEAIYFSRSPIPYNRDQDPSILYYKHIGIYGYRKDILSQICHLQPTMLERSEKLEQLRFLDYGFTIAVEETVFETYGVDTDEDLYRVEHLLKMRGTTKPH